MTSDLAFLKKLHQGIINRYNIGINNTENIVLIKIEIEERIKQLKGEQE